MENSLNNKQLEANDNYLKDAIIFDNYIGDMTFNELIKNPKEFSYKKNEKNQTSKINIVKEINNKIVSVEITEYPYGYSENAHCFEKLDNKKDFKDTIKLMRKEGMSQSKIATAIGISQSYVSKLLKE